MFRTEYVSSEFKGGEFQEIPAKVADTIREQSKNLTKLTPADTIRKLVTDIDPDNVMANLADMENDKRYRDIVAVASPTGNVYLYSEKYITQNQAEILVQNEDIKTKLAETVREDSKNLAKLTGLDSLSNSFPGEPDKLKTTVAEILTDERYQDIQSLVTSKGAPFLYSKTYITRTYADILVRTEANDPCSTIAGMVRDESRIYPRPTNVESLKNPLFKITPEEFEGHVASTLERQEFKDVKLINASTGARYLFSSLYLNEDLARSLIEWEEVGRFENP